MSFGKLSPSPIFRLKSKRREQSVTELRKLVHVRQNSLHQFQLRLNLNHPPADNIKNYGHKVTFVIKKACPSRSKSILSERSAKVRSHNRGIFESKYIEDLRKLRSNVQLPKLPDAQVAFRLEGLIRKRSRSEHNMSHMSSVRETIKNKSAITQTANF